MNPDTLQALAAFIQAQRSANMGAISAIIEVLKLIPAGPEREPAIESLQELVDRSEAVNTICEPLYQALLVEAQNARRS